MIQYWKEQIGGMAADLVYGEDGRPVGPNFDRAVWKKVRGPCCGSSDTPAIFGKDDNDKQSWKVWDRIVLGQWEDDPEGGDIRRGNRQEEPARQVFTERTGLRVQPLTMLAHPQDHNIVTDLDGLISHPGKEWPRAILDNGLWQEVAKCSGPGALEIKVPRVKNFYKVKSEGLSQGRVLQFQHHLMVSGLSWGFYMVFTPEYDDCILFPFVRHDKLCKWLFVALRKWRAEHVDTKTRPLRPAPPPPRWPDPVPGEAVTRDDPAWLEAAGRLVEAHYTLLSAQAAHGAAEAAVIALAGEEDRHLAGGGVVFKRYSTAQQTRKDAGAYEAAVALAKQEGKDPSELNPKDFTFKTKSNEKVDVKVVVGPPDGMDLEGM